ncbi:helix-hairpin-helix domain-containing protein [Streptomyces sp. NPDC051561]|uniref:helix-hairpin-helix domain-containing protein n=1 Tax=Streptomyces sp. NPDC051561 TaxID=3365658 RepID=UPI0037BCBFB0
MSPAPVRTPAAPPAIPTIPVGGLRGIGGLRRAWTATRERVPVWVQVRCGMEPRTVGALAAVLVVSAGFALHHFWTGRPESVRPPETVGVAGPVAPRSSVPRVPAPPFGPSAAGTLPSGPQVPVQAPGGAVVVVDVSGEVRRPGVHRLPAGSRVADALRMAGGVKRGKDVGGLNRARVLTDGEQVVVGGPAPAAPAVGGGAGPGGASPTAPVSLNSATVEQLDTLPGVGPVLARHIVDYRTQHGGFRSVEELREVNGIGDRRFTDLQQLVRP